MALKLREKWLEKYETHEKNSKNKVQEILNSAIEDCGSFKKIHIIDSAEAHNYDSNYDYCYIISKDEAKFIFLYDDKEDITPIVKRILQNEKIEYEYSYGRLILYMDQSVT